MPLPASIDDTVAMLAAGDYVADRSLATTVFLALRMGRPLLLEGEAGVGKTEIAKVLARGLGRDLIRLQCYEGLDVGHAVYEWNYPRQMIEIRMAEASGATGNHRILAPIDGIFYCRPSPEAPAFVSVGDRVVEGTTLGLVEVMKTFNPVRYGGGGAPAEGVVVAVEVVDQSEVSAGQVLLVIG